MRVLWTSQSDQYPRCTRDVHLAQIGLCLRPACVAFSPSATSTPVTPFLQATVDQALPALIDVFMRLLHD